MAGATVINKNTGGRSFLITVGLMMTLTGISGFAMSGETDSPADPTNTKQVERGEKIYMRFCSLCHGRKLEGEPNWHLPKADGKMPAPPHDESGHTWHHADIVLFNITKYGLVPPHAPKGYQSDMPAWEGTLKDEDIWAVLAFIKSRWPEQHREFQKKVTEDYKPF